MVTNSQGTLYCSVSVPEFSIQQVPAQNFNRYLRSRYFGPNKSFTDLVMLTSLCQSLGLGWCLLLGLGMAKGRTENADPTFSGSKNSLTEIPTPKTQGQKLRDQKN